MDPILRSLYYNYHHLIHYWSYVIQTCFAYRYSLSVSSNAQGAKVYRDGQDTGQFTPALLQGLKPNIDYMIKVSAKGYDPEEDKVVYSPEFIAKSKEANKELALRFFLKRAKGALRAKSTPSGATVYLGNEYLGKTPFYKRSVERSEGGVQLKFRKSGCETKTVILNWGNDLEIPDLPFKVQIR